MEQTGKEALQLRESPQEEAKTPKPRSPDKQPENVSTANPPENRKPAKQPENRKTTSQLLIGFLGEAALIALAVWTVLTFVVCVRIHYGNYMFPAFRDGDLVITYRLQRPFPDAAVIYEHEGELRLGRVVGMPGYVIDISEEGALRINGSVPAEEVFYPTVPSVRGEIAYPYTVGEGQVFILNDYRLDTNDSRRFGGVDMEDVKGPMLLSMRRRGF